MLEISQKLEKLADLYSGQKAIQAEKRDVIAQLLSPEVLTRLDEIDAEFLQKEEAASTTISELEDENKAEKRD